MKAREKQEKKARNQIEAKKLAMSQLFVNGKMVPVTLLEVQNSQELDALKPEDKVKVSGVSKGKGFQGVVKRHGASGGPASHGHRHVLRTPGSTGSRFPQHTLKGRKMPGQTGRKLVSLRGIKIMAVDKDTGLIAVKGAVPGGRNAKVKLTLA
jgi:large subunit ribosomal protein L3